MDEMVQELKAGQEFWCASGRDTAAATSLSRLGAAAAVAARAPDARTCHAAPSNSRTANTATVNARAYTRTAYARTADPRTAYTATVNAWAYTRTAHTRTTYARTANAKAPHGWPNADAEYANKCIPATSTAYRARPRSNASDDDPAAPAGVTSATAIHVASANPAYADETSTWFPHAAVRGPYDADGTSRRTRIACAITDDSVAEPVATARAGSITNATHAHAGTSLPQTKVWRASWGPRQRINQLESRSIPLFAFPFRNTPRL